MKVLFSVFSIVLACSWSAGPVKISQPAIAGLTFEERVSHQRAIEEIYWRHRIWPKERPDPKPSFDAVISQAQLEKKVADYLRNSEALEDYWQRPISAEQLQAEMDRMARDTKQPEVLRELFEALRNDPFVIAECVARPALSERLVTNFYSHDERFHGELRRRAEAELRGHKTVEQMKQSSGNYSEIEFVRNENSDAPDSSGFYSVRLNAREWDETVQKLAAMFSDGGPVVAGVPPSKGGPIAQIKTGILSPLQEDESRYYATAVIERANDRLKIATVAWPKKPFESRRSGARKQTTKAMGAPSSSYALPTVNDLSIGGRYNPSTDSWTATNGAPSARSGHTAVWTGSEVVIWGGDDCCNFFNTGGRYSPSTDSWTATSTNNAPSARALHTAIWTGSEMIVWGGGLNTGGRYNPVTDSWAATSTIKAPSTRRLHTAVWTGSEMIIWGGVDASGPLNSGGRYNPDTDSWTTTSTSNAASGREFHTAIWTGSEMIVWGGIDETFSYTNTGGRYNPDTDSWIATSTTDAPIARASQTAVWTSSEMIVWGGSNGNYLNAGGRYNPTTDSWTTTSIANAPEGRAFYTAIWTGSEMIVWGGVFVDNEFHYLNTGGRYNPDTDSWTATTTNDAPFGREFHTAVWTGNEMIVWGGDFSDENNDNPYYLNTGGRYNPDTDSWVSTSPPANRSFHTAVWTGNEMIVWGGRNENFVYLNTGGRYNPATDNWAATSTINAPSARYLHAAVWTGSEMIVWGGTDSGGNRLNNGSKYNPDADSWTTTTTTNAPSGRYLHTAVWTGNEMIVWGGWDGGDTTSGGRYNPGTDSWIATNTTNAPAGRTRHTAVWSGSEMIVWGGALDGFVLTNTGGRYDPSMDSWMATSTANAPDVRYEQTAVWTGSEMIVWGGSTICPPCYSYTGGRYNPITDSWTATNTSDAPSSRYDHTAVWTGAEMIVWGGYFYDTGYVNTGGRYSPGTDSWTITSTTNAPAPRSGHTAVWTGSEMIVWGGNGPTGPSVTPTPTPTPTASPTTTPRPSPTPRPRPSPLPRPTAQ